MNIRQDDGARCWLGPVPGTWWADGLSLSSAILSPWRYNPAYVSAKPVQTATGPDLVHTCYPSLLGDQALTLRQPLPAPLPLAPSKEGREEGQARVSAS